MTFNGHHITGKNLLASLKSVQSNISVRLTICALIAGLLGGYGSLAFRIAIDEVQQLFYGFGGELVVSQAIHLPWWKILLIPVIGGLLVGICLKIFHSERRTEGVADVIESVMINRGKMKFLPGVGTFLTSAISLGTGGSGGREGPVVHFGATIASQIAQGLRIPSRYYPILIGCGVASGVAASFNAPIAGMFFALEVVLGSLATQAVAPIVLAAVIGTVVTRIHIGDFPAFIIPHYQIISWWEIPAISLLGVVSAIVGLLFIWSMGFSERTIKRFRIPIILRPAAGGLVLGAIAIFFPQIIGVGYEATDSALQGEYELILLLSLIVIKTVAVGITFGSGFGGGFFSPSLFVGAMTGGAFGLIAATIFPDLAASHGLYAIIGMTAVACAVLSAPISTIMIVFELTGDYKIAILVMIAVAITTLITRQIAGKSIFQMQLAKRGVDLKDSKALRYLKYRNVQGIMDTEFIKILAPTKIMDLLKIARDAPHDKFIIIDPETNSFKGRLDFADIKPHLFEETIDEEITALDLASHDTPTLRPNSTLKQALHLFEETGMDCIPVIEDAPNPKILGLLHSKDLFRKFNEALVDMQDENRDKVIR
ncbi:MAG: chloride channel protein [Sneathiella sp.]